MKLILAMLLAAGFLLTLSCGGGKEEIKPAAEAEVVETAATLLEKGQKENEAGQLNDAVQTLSQLLEDFLGIEA